MTATAVPPPPPALPQPTLYRPFPVASLPAMLGDYVEAVAAATDTDESFAALGVLTICAGCIGNRVVAEPRSGWKEPVVLWGAIVGRSGSAKSPVLKLLIEPLVQMTKRQHIDYRKAVEKYEQAIEERKAKGRKATGAMPAKPIEHRLLVGDATMEKLADLLGQNPLGLLLVRDELSGWVGSFDKYRSSKGADAASWLEMYRAGHIQIDRKSGLPILVDKAAVSILGGIQPRTLVRVFGEQERESGLLARLLLVQPPERVAKWSDLGLPKEASQMWCNVIGSLLRLPHKVDSLGTPDPISIPIGDDAKPAWIRWHDEHSKETAERAFDDDLAAYFSKLKGVCVRLALILECVEAGSSGIMPTQIGSGAMRRSIECIEWFKHEGTRVYGLLRSNSREDPRTHLVELIRRKGGLITVRQLQQASRQFKTAIAAEQALVDLVKRGVGVWTQPSSDRQSGTRCFRLNEAKPATNIPRY